MTRWRCYCPARDHDTKNGQCYKYATEGKYRQGDYCADCRRRGFVYEIGLKPDPDNKRPFDWVRPVKGTERHLSE